VQLERQQQVRAVPRCEVQREAQAAAGDVRRRRQAGHRRRPHHRVPPARGESHPALDGARLNLGVRHAGHTAQHEHRPEVGGQRELQVDVDRLPAVEVDVHGLEHRRLVLERALEPELQRLQLEAPAVGQLELRVRQLVDGVAARDGRRDQQPGRHAGDPQLMAGQEAAVVAIEPERVVAGQRHAAVGLRDEEGVGRLEHDRVGEVRGRAHRRRASSASMRASSSQASTAPA
jgi:hypothetical protein